MIEPLLEVMARLRDPDTGCRWDVDQSFASIAPYTIEEAYEVVDAIARDDMADLKDELGDLLLQTVFHARIAEEAGHFAFGDVVEAVVAKLVRRHPHVFGDALRESGHAEWEWIKATERTGKNDKSALAGVALALPALLRAEKLQKRAARTGFDWPDATGPRAKIDEELAEAEAASVDALSGEVGDLLFAVVNWARHMKIDPEAALREANAKFERRFRAIETEPGFAELDLAAKEALWQGVKARAG